MADHDFYNTLAWEAARAAALARDNHRCVAAWLLGGDCSDALHVHHIIPVEERPDLSLTLSNLVTVCACHHPQLEAIRRSIRRARGTEWKRCRHPHPTREGREACERKLNAARVAA